jgi:hypothetical protein
MFVVVIWTMTPTQKMMFQKTMEYLRPNLSEMGAAIRAPMRVPMDSYGVVRIRDMVVVKGILPKQQSIHSSNY